MGTRASKGEEGEEREKNMAGMGRHGHVFASLGFLLGFLCSGERERKPGDR